MLRLLSNTADDAKNRLISDLFTAVTWVVSTVLAGIFILTKVRYIYLAAKMKRHAYLELALSLVSDG